MTLITDDHFTLKKRKLPPTYMIHTHTHIYIYIYIYFFFKVKDTRPPNIRLKFLWLLGIPDYTINEAPKGDVRLRYLKDSN